MRKHIDADGNEHDLDGGTILSQLTDMYPIWTVEDFRRLEEKLDKVLDILTQYE